MLHVFKSWYRIELFVIFHRCFVEVGISTLYSIMNPGRLENASWFILVSHYKVCGLMQSVIMVHGLLGIAWNLP